jgi:tetratricopeptide (TPR) repeat protein
MLVGCLPETRRDYYSLYASILSCVIEYDDECMEIIILQFIKEVEEKPIYPTKKVDYYFALINELVNKNTIIPALRRLKFVLDNIPEAHKAFIVKTYDFIFDLPFYSYEDFASWLPTDANICNVMTRRTEVNKLLVTQHFEWFLKVVERTQKMKGHFEFVISLGITETHMFVEALQTSNLKQIIDNCSYDWVEIVKSILFKNGIPTNKEALVTFTALLDIEKDKKLEILLRTAEAIVNTHNHLLEVEKLLRLISEIDPKNVRAHWILFEYLIQKSDVDRAQGTALTLLSIEPDKNKMIECLLKLNMLLINKNNLDKVLKNCDAGLALDPNERRLLTQKLFILKAKKQYEKILDILLPLLKQTDPKEKYPEGSLPLNNIYAHMYNAYNGLEMFEKAYETICTLRELDPNNINIITGYVDSLFNLSKTEEALKSINESMIAFPNNPVLHRQRARLYLFKNDLSEAWRDITDSLRFQPTDDQALMIRAHLRLKNKEFEEGLKDFKKISPKFDRTLTFYQIVECEILVYEQKYVLAQEKLIQLIANIKTRKIKVPIFEYLLATAEKLLTRIDPLCKGQ